MRLSRYIKYTKNFTSSISLAATIMTSSNSNLFLNRAKFVMRCMGVWIPSESESFPFKLCRYFTITLQYLFAIFQTIFIVQVWGDLEALSQPFCFLFTQYSLCFKVTVFHVNAYKLRDLLIQMDGKIFQPHSDKHKKILRKQAIRIKRLLLGFMISSQLTCSLWVLIPLFDVPLFDYVGPRKFPFEMWMPVSPDASPQYEMGYAFQLLTVFMSAYMYFGVDSVALSLLIFACAQIEIIMDKIMTVTPLNYGMNNEDRQKTVKENHKKLIDCVQHHQAVNAFMKLAQDTYHTYIFFQISGSVGIFCMTALRLIVMEWESVQFFSMITYLYVMIFELFVCCWCGHELTATSELLPTAMYSCLWYEQDIQFQRALCFAILRMNRPIVYRAGNYISLSKETFISILRMSYSYFAVLVNQADEKV